MESIYKMLIKNLLGIDLSDEELKSLFYMFDKEETLENLLNAYPEINKHELTSAYCIYRTLTYACLYYS